MRAMMRRILAVLALTSGLGLGAGQGWAQSLNDALASAYRSNPTILAARAGQRANDEQVPAALSGWRPTVTVNGSVQQVWEDRNGTDIVGNPIKPQSYRPRQLSIQLNQPVFRGFRTTGEVNAAEARVRAGQQSLFATEQQTLFDAVQAYMNVYSGRLLVQLQQENVTVLQGQLRASNERFAVGEITRTDVAQSRASLAQAQANLANAQAQLAGNVARYLAVIGREPGKLFYPKVAKLPKSLQSALASAGEINPQILARAFVEDATVHDITVAKSPMLPQINIEAQAVIADHQSSSDQGIAQASIGANLTWQLYGGGAVAANVRRAKQLASQSRIQVVEIAREVRRAVSASWNEFNALGEIITAAKAQVAAASLALDGVQQEYQAGTRTTLDVLNAQAALVAARTTLVTAERNRVISAYGLLASVGQLTPEYIGLKVDVYDPNENYDATRNKLIGTKVEVLE